MRNPSDWIHFKIYRQQCDQLVLHKILLLSINETRQFLAHLINVSREARDGFFNHNPYSIRQEEEHRSLTVTPTEHRALVDNYWEICQTPRRKISVGSIYYDRESLTKTDLSIRLYTRAAPLDEYRRKGVLSIKWEELEQLHEKTELVMAELVREKVRSTALHSQQTQ